MRQLNAAGILALDERQLELAAFACERHSGPVVTTDSTVAVCWDADRLGLGRIGVVPDPRFLSLEASRLHEPGPAPFAWSNVYAQSVRLTTDRG